MPLIDNAMSVLQLQSAAIFEVWTDAEAEEMNRGCIEQLKRSHKGYDADIRERLRICVQAQKRVRDALQEMELLCYN